MEVMNHFGVLDLTEEELMMVDGGNVWYDLGYKAYNWVQSLPQQLEEWNEIRKLPGPDNFPRGDVRGSDWYEEVVGA